MLLSGEGCVCFSFLLSPAEPQQKTLPAVGEGFLPTILILGDQD